MTPFPTWLPAMARVTPWTQHTFDQLYSVFERDFRATQPMYEGCPVWFFPEIEDGKEVIFWHLTHRKDSESGQRLPDLRRCERLPWVRALIDHSREPEVLAWDHEEANGRVNTYLWLRDHDFVVLMRRYADGRRRLLTSFYVTYPNYRRKLEKKHKRRLA
jgi:hypothetical protein